MGLGKIIDIKKDVWYNKIRKKQEESNMTKKITKRILALLLAAMLVFPFAACGKKEPEKIEEPNTLSEIINYCNTRYKEKLSLESMERDLHISKYYISHVINEKIGKGFNEYVNSIRINEACRLLLESELTVKEISEKVGFGTVRSFDRAFKKQKNETAKEYRARNCEKIKKD